MRETGSYTEADGRKTMAEPEFQEKVEVLTECNKLYY